MTTITRALRPHERMRDSGFLPGEGMSALAFKGRRGRGKKKLRSLECLLKVAAMAKLCGHKGEREDVEGGDPGALL